MDGVRWTKYAGNPVLDVVLSSCDGSGVAAPAVGFKDNHFIMFYVGWGGDRAIQENPLKCGKYSC